MVVVLIRRGDDVLELMPESIHESLENDLSLYGLCCYERKADGSVAYVDPMTVRVEFGVKE